MLITVGIPTKNRYDSLDKTLLSIAFQTHLPKEIFIIDDSDEPIDIRNIPHYEYILRLLNEKGVEWKYVFGLKKGQHHSHQYVQDNAVGDWIFRIDDDEVAEPNCLEILSDFIKDSDDSRIGAVAPSVTMPGATQLPEGLRNSMETIYTAPNMQWFNDIEGGAYEVEHLYSCFLYRKGIVNYDLSLSTVAHREESIFSHSICKAGYSLYVDMTAQVHHFRADKGGIRNFHDQQLWEHDEKIFRNYMNIWGYTKEEKIVVLQSGLGDHWAFKHILPELKEKYKNIVIASSFPGVFDNDGVKVISVAEAQMLYGNIDIYNIYHFMGSRNWDKSLVEAFREMYLGNENNNITIQPEIKNERKPKKLSLGEVVKGYQLITS